MKVIRAFTVILILFLAGCSFIQVEGNWQVAFIPSPCGGPNVAAPPLVVGEGSEAFFDSLAKRIGVSLKASVRNNDSCSWYTSGVGHGGFQRK